ncbi:MAG: hypothetical protein HYW78_01470 [Parcubacteria group bacterium]|nr:hypothetical protein [Parcubacteria group bacterium]
MNWKNIFVFMASAQCVISTTVLLTAFVMRYFNIWNANIFFLIGILEAISILWIGIYLFDKHRNEVVTR